MPTVSSSVGMVHPRLGSLRAASEVRNRLPAVALILIGSVTTVAWFVRAETWVRPLGAARPMVFNVAVSITLAAVAMLLPARLRARRGLVLAAAALIGGYSVLTLVQDVFDVSFGVDELFVSAHGFDVRAPHPGRASPNTAIALLLTALGLWLFERRPTLKVGFALPVITFAIGVLGLATVAGYALKLHLLYPWFRFAQMPIHVGGVFVLVAADFWFRWQGQNVYAALFRGREDRKIGLVAGGILITSALSVGLAVLSGDVREAERFVQRSLAIALEQDAARLEHTLVSERRILELLSAQSAVHQAAASPGDPAAADGFRAVFGTRYRYVALRDARGRTLVDLGTMPRFDLDVSFPAYPGAGLAFERELMMRLTVPVQSAASKFELAVVVPVPELELSLKAPRTMGESASLNLCVDAGGERLRCFPSRHRPHVTVRVKHVRGDTVPMARALAGELGVASHTLDTRGVDVLAAFRPLPAFGMGAVLKVQSAELYQPIAAQLERAFPYLLGLVLLGVWLVHAQVSPLVRSILDAELEASRMTRALLRSERHTRSILDGISDGIVSLEEDGTIRSLNPATARLLGAAPDFILGRQVGDFIAGKARGEVLAVCRGAIRTPDEHEPRAVAVELLRADGTQLDGEVVIGKAEADEPYAVAVLRDVSQQRHVQRMKDQFVSMVSHELRTPLTAIRGALGLVTGGVGGAVPESANKLLRIAFENCERLIHLINDILDVERMAAGKAHFAFKPVQLSEIVNKTVESMRAHATVHHVTLQLRELTASAVVTADPDRIQQALTNLISNAVKYSPRGAVVEVSVEQRPKAFRVLVSDQGEGVPESFRDRIFQPFAQADSTSKRSKGGSGLGLSITRSIMERHRGSVDYWTREEGGTTFFLELPESRLPLGAPTLASLPPPPEAPRLARILHVEDDEQSRELMSALLQGVAEVTGVSSMSQALERLRQERSDLVLLDLELKRELGSDVLRVIRRRKLANVVVVYTAHDELLDESVRELADDVLIKTRISETELKARIEALLRTSGRFESAVPLHAS